MNCKYYIWRVGTNNPVYSHSNEAQAMEEAKRLSTESPGKIFLILMSLGQYAVDMPIPIYTRYHDTFPF